MGDIIEVKLSGYEPRIFYKMPEEGMWFDLKCLNSAIIALSETPGGFVRCMIAFRNPGSIWLKERRRPAHVTGLPFTLSNNEYTRFWVAQKDEEIMVGMGDSCKSVISIPTTKPLNYILFTVPTYGQYEFDRICATFRFAVPPLRLKMPNVQHSNILEEGLQWKRCGDHIPDDSVIGGHLKGECVYVIRARYRSSLTPGLFIPTMCEGFIPWGGRANIVEDFEALCGYNYEWTRVSDNKIPVSAFVAGYSETDREPLYIGRCSEQHVPGKVQQSHKVCYIPFEDCEVAVKEFDVLTLPGLNIHCAHEFISMKDQVFVVSSDEEDDHFDNAEDDEGYEQEEAINYAF